MKPRRWGLVGAAAIAGPTAAVSQGQEIQRFGCAATGSDDDATLAGGRRARQMDRFVLRQGFRVLGAWRD
jgi:hypothetical protein